MVLIIYVKIIWFEEAGLLRFPPGLLRALSPACLARRDSWKQGHGVRDSCHQRGPARPLMAGCDSAGPSPQLAILSTPFSLSKKFKFS